MVLKTRFEENLKEAMRNTNITERDTIRMVLTSIKLAEVERGKALDDNEVISILQKEIKLRKETILEAEKGNRDDVITSIKKEIEILENYLPKQMSNDEIRIIIEKIIKEVGAQDIKDMGKVMKIAVLEIAGKAPNDLISQAVRVMLTEKHA
jgi:uncharacterized protein YqeY